jgi:two-component system response regulator
MSRGGTILLVEDNPDDIELTLRAFEGSDFVRDVVVVRDGAEAIDYLFQTGSHSGRDPSAVPDVVLLDLNLPKVDGLQVLEAIRADARTRLLPVVVLTSSKDDRDVLQSYQRGANSFVRKPVDFGVFVDAARQLGLYWLSLNEIVPTSGPGESNEHRTDGDRKKTAAPHHRRG